MFENPSSLNAKIDLTKLIAARASIIKGHEKILCLSRKISLKKKQCFNMMEKIRSDH